MTTADYIHLALMDDVFSAGIKDKLLEKRIIDNVTELYREADKAHWNELEAQLTRSYEVLNDQAGILRARMAAQEKLEGQFKDAERLLGEYREAVSFWMEAAEKLKQQNACQSMMLEQAKEIVLHASRLWSASENEYDEWLADLEKGPIK